MTIAEENILLEILGKIELLEYIHTKYDYNESEFIEDDRYEFEIGLILLEIGELMGKIDIKFKNKFGIKPFRENILQLEDYPEPEQIWEIATTEIDLLKKEIIAYLKLDEFEIE